MINTKTLAEQLREFIDRVNETPVHRSYDLECTIPNFELPEDYTDEQLEAWEDDLQVGVDYTIEGKYYPATRDEPAEHPEIGDWHVYNYATGEDITQRLSDDQTDSLEEKIWKQVDGVRNHDRFDEPDTDY